MKALSGLGVELYGPGSVDNAGFQRIALSYIIFGLVICCFASFIITNPLSTAGEIVVIDYHCQEV